MPVYDRERENSRLVSFRKNQFVSIPNALTALHSLPAAAGSEHMRRVAFDDPPWLQILTNWSCQSSSQFG
jgi:hypothetical protein